MLHRVDRVQVTGHNAQAVADRWCQVLDCEVAGADEVEALHAKRITLSVGDSLVEILEPVGPGLARSHLDIGRGGPFSVGVSANDVGALREHLGTLGVERIELGEQLFLHETHLGIAGLNVLVSPHAEREPVGLMKNLYEATHLTLEAPRAIADIARMFALDADAFVPIHSDQYGYDGALTLFDSSELHRIETIHPFDKAKTMGRFLERFGPSLYMCYGETDDLAAVRERLKSVAPGDWTGSDDNDDGLFIHPKALGGVMMGVSRTTHAWTWSGYPERRVAGPTG
ncbi:MAG: hypothetical protein OES38_00465 [Gammaproteobacteria bacterium]|nr:hypothetical protein [Gammaproteobacteria bacterium]